MSFLPLWLVPIISDRAGYPCELGTDLGALLRGSRSGPSGRRPAPAELHALALGDEEQVVAQRAYVLVVEGHHAETAVAVGPGERCQVPDHRGLGGHPPAVGERQAPLREVEAYPPALVGGELEVAGEHPRGDHALLEIEGKGPLVRLDPGQVVRVVHQPRRRRDVGTALSDQDLLRRVEPDERDGRAPEVLYHPEGDVASPPRVPHRLGVACPCETHVTWLPRVRLSHGPKSATAAAYAAYLFHDARILQPTKRWRSGGTHRPRKRRGACAPPLIFEGFLLLLAAQRDQVQQRQQRGERRRNVREGGRREDPLGPVRLTAREDPVARQEPVGAGGSVDLDRQRHNVEEQYAGERDHGELDKELARCRPHAQDDGQEEQREPKLPREAHYREEPRPELHGQVPARVLDGVPDLVGGHADARYGVAPEVVLREPHDLAPGVVVVGERSRHRLDPHVGEVVAIQDRARRLRPGQAAGRRLLGILAVRAPYPERRGPGDEGAHDHH